MHPQELNPYKPPDNAKKGVECTPLKLPKFYISAVSAVVEPHPRSITNTQYIITFCPAFDRLAISPALKDGLVEVITFFNCQLHNIPPYIQYFPSYPGKSKPGNRTPGTPTLLIICFFGVFCKLSIKQITCCCFCFFLCISCLFLFCLV